MPGTYDIEVIRELQPSPEVDDFKFARCMVDEMSCTRPHLQMHYLAVWVARLREHFVQVGRELSKTD